MNVVKGSLLRDGNGTRKLGNCSCLKVGCCQDINLLGVVGTSLEKKGLDERMES